jgi:hypothetical protein
MVLRVGEKTANKMAIELDTRCGRIPKAKIFREDLQYGKCLGPDL